MGLLTKTIKVKVHSTTIKHYEELGYDIPKRQMVNKSISKKYGREWAYDIGAEMEVNVLDLPEKSKSPVEVECDKCKRNKIISYVSYCTTQKDGRYYCHSCANEIFNSREKNHNWNFNLTSEDRAVSRDRYLDPRNAAFIKAVRKRDDNKCIVCGNKADEVHHLNSWETFPDERYNTDNGCCLCHRCHRAYHNATSFGKNTKEEFYNWLGYVHNFDNVDDCMVESTKIYCIEDEETYTVRQFAKKYNIKNTSEIYHVLNKDIRKHPKTGHNYKVKSVKGMHLLYLDEYEKMPQKDIEDYLLESSISYKKNTKEILCATTGIKYKSQTQAIKKDILGINSISPIGNCCCGRQKTAGQLQDGTRLEWMYLDDFNNLSNEEQLNLIEQNLQTLEEGSFLMQRYRELQDNAQVLNVS